MTLLHQTAAESDFLLQLYPRFTWGWVATWHENFPDGVKCPAASPQQANATYVLPDGTCPPNEGEGNIGCGNKVRPQFFILDTQAFAVYG